MKIKCPKCNTEIEINPGELLGKSKSPVKRAAGVENMAKARAARKQVGWPKGKPRKNEE